MPTEPRAPGPQAPVAVLDLDLDLDLAAGSDVSVNPRYTAARVLVRHGQAPLAWVDLPLVDGRATRQALRDAVPEDAVPDDRQPPPTAPVTVVVCTVGRPEMLRRALASLLAGDHPDLDLLVVDNRPWDPSTRDVVAALEDPRVRLVEEPVPGLSGARNRGIVHARHPIIAFTDDDVVVDPSWVRWLTAPLVSGEAEVTTGLVLPAELETQAQLFFEGYGGFARGMQRRAFDLADRSAIGEHLVYPFNGGSFGSGNAMAFTRAALERIGGFDPALGAGTLTGGGEDIDVFSHLVLTGATLVYEPRAVCWHTHRREDEALRAQIRSYGTGFGAVLTKWTLRSGRLRRGLVRRTGTLLQALRPGRPAAARDRPESPPELSVLELKGMLAAPLLYARAVRRARRARHLLARVGPSVGGPDAAAPVRGPGLRGTGGG